MPIWLVLAAAGFAGFRLARLVTVDTILEEPRTWAAVHFPKRWVPLVTCPVCTGWWIAGILVAAAVWSGLLPARWWVLWLGWPAAAGLGVILSVVDARLVR